jgi:hypothetical protein
MIGKPPMAAYVTTAGNQAGRLSVGVTASATWISSQLNTM